MSFYRNLDQLLSECPEARGFYSGLSATMQRRIRQHAQEIQSLCALQSFADGAPKGGRE